MAKELTISNKSSLAVLNKAKNLLNITNSLLNKNRDIQSFENYRFYVEIEDSQNVYYILLTVTPDGKYMILGNDTIIKLFNIESGKEIKIFKGHNYVVLSAVVTPDGKYIVSGGNDDTIRVWDIDKGKEIKVFKGLNYCGPYINSIAIAPNGKYIVPVSDLDNLIRLWDIETGNTIKVFEGDVLWENNITSVAITSDGRYIVSGSVHGILKIWDIFKGKEVLHFKLGSIYSLAITPDGKYIVVGESNGIIRLLEIESESEIRTFEGHDELVGSVVITPDGKYIVSGSGDNTVKLWEIESGKEIKTFKGHSSSVDSIEIISDGRYILSGSRDNTVKLWDIQTGKEMMTYVFLKYNEWIVYTPEGYYNCSDGAKKYISFFDENDNLLESNHPIYKQRKKEKLLDLDI